MTGRNAIGISGTASANALASVGYRWSNERQSDAASAPPGEFSEAAPLGVSRNPALVTPSSKRSEYIQPSSITWCTAAQSSGYGPSGRPVLFARLSGAQLSPVACRDWEWSTGKNGSKPAPGVRLLNLNDFLGSPHGHHSTAL